MRKEELMNIEQNQHPEQQPDPEKDQMQPENLGEYLYDDGEESMSLSEYNLHADEELEGLLDEALGQVEVPNYLADQIIGKTMPAFEQQKLRSLHRINPAYIRAVAAMLALAAIGVLGLHLAGTIKHTPRSTGPIVVKPTDQPGENQGVQIMTADQLAAKMEQIDQRLAAVAALSEPVDFAVNGVDDTDYYDNVDTQLDLLALRMGVVEDSQTATNEEDVVELAVMDYQLQELMNEDAFYF
ncbi:hypothetical protein JD969_07865 [Planctomycetota bacterium]|nr:hypothetical protein JD969_07865 [Planctomycetota bacterium]